ncbi:MAG: hypothetical protein ACFE7E_08185 [Candidatus Hodarchaeota archaeon]
MGIYRLTEKSTKIALSLPESGMGYQVIRSGERFFWILNAFLALDLEDVFKKETLLEYRNLLWGDPKEEKYVQLKTLEISPNSQVAFSDLEAHLDADLQRFSFKYSANISPFLPWTVRARRPYAYFRYGPFARDHRVDPSNGDYLRGSYATTYNDTFQVPSGFAAIGRYALPNPSSARCVFAIVTYDRPTCMGTATPNFGQAGGGVEVFFQSGAKNSPGSSFIINLG